MTKDTDQKTGQGEGKNCSTCMEWKPLTDYYTLKRKDGVRRAVASCKTCTAANAARRYAENPGKVYDRVKAWRLLPGNREIKNAGEVERRKKPEVKESTAAYRKEYRSREEVREASARKKRIRRATDEDFRQKSLLEQREYYSRPEVIAAGKAKRKIRNADPKVKQAFNEYRRIRYREDPLFACQDQISKFVRRVIAAVGTEKEGRSHDILGYSPAQLKQRMECQFRPGMNWANKGEWHIDHKKPIAEFLRQGITDPRTINSLCNLQPLWAEENQMKSDKWPFIAAANDNPNTREAA